MSYAYDAIPDSAREHLAPNLRLAAQNPWMGLTAYIGERPHLIIGKQGEDFIVEDEYGKVAVVDFMFPWEEPKVEGNRLVAASRIQGSPFREAGLLAYDPETGEWAIRVGASNMRYPLDEEVAELEARDWSLNPIYADVVPDIIKEPGDQPSAPTIEARAACPHCHSDQHLEEMTDQEADKHSGKEKMYACHHCGKWSFEHELEISDHDKDEQENNNDVDHDGDKDGPERHQAPHPNDPKESAVAKAFSFQGALVIQGPPANGVALKPDEQSNEDMLHVIHSLTPGGAHIDKYVQQKNQEHGTSFPRFDNPFVNRGGSARVAAPTDWHGESLGAPPQQYMPRTTPSYPEEFPGEGFILAAKWLTPEHTAIFLEAGVKNRQFRGIVTSSGGATSHAVVVAQQESIPCIITDHDNVDQINPGDHVSIESNGVVHVNGGDPNFVAQDPSSIKAKTAIFRWAWSTGHGKAARIDPNDINKAGTGHNDLMQSLMADNHFDFTDATVGYIYDDGSVDEDSGNPITDQAALESWLRTFGAAVNIPITAIRKVDISAYALGPGGAIGKVAATGEMPYPGGQGIHNGTSGLFSQAGLQAVVHLPDGPVINLPFTAPNTFMVIMKWKMADYPQAHAGASPEGALMKIECHDPHQAEQLILQASGSAAPMPGPTAAADDDDDDNNENKATMDHPVKAIKCPNCQSHTFEALHKNEEKGTAEFICLNCHQPFKTDYRKKAAEGKDGITDPPKVPGGAHSPGTRVEMTRQEMRGTRGSIMDHHSEDPIFPGQHYYNVLLDDGRTLKGVHETTFNKIKSASVVADYAGPNTIGYPTDPGHQAQIRQLLNQIATARQRGDQQEVLDLQQQLEALLTGGQSSTQQQNTTPGVLSHADIDEFSDDNPPVWFIQELNQQLIASLQKGAPYPENSYENAPDHTPKKQKKDWPAEVNAIYNACMREGNGSGDSKEEKQSSCAAIAWAQYKKTVKDKGKGNTKDEKKGRHLGGTEVLADGITVLNEYKTDYNEGDRVETPWGYGTVEQTNEYRYGDTPAYNWTVKFDSPGEYGESDTLSADELRLVLSTKVAVGKQRIAFFVTPEGQIVSPGSWHADSEDNPTLAHLPTTAAFAGALEQYMGKWILGWGSGSYGLQPSPEQKEQYAPLILKWAAAQGIDPSSIMVMGRAEPMIEDILTGIDEPWLGKGYEGHPVMCYMCGNERTASLGTRCEHCGYVLTVRRDAPPFKQAAVAEDTEEGLRQLQGKIKAIIDGTADESTWQSIKAIAHTPEGKAAIVAFVSGLSYIPEQILYQIFSSVKSAALNTGEWYTMRSPNYKVPDVIQVLEVNEQGVTAAIEGDDKGLFPITLNHDEIEREGYTFEPYSSGAIMDRTGNYFLEGQGEQKEQKEARRNFTIREQQDLINENPDQRARNIHKLDLDGTHYNPDIEARIDPLSLVDDNPLWLW